MLFRFLLADGPLKVAYIFRRLDVTLMPERNNF